MRRTIRLGVVGTLLGAAAFAVEARAQQASAALPAPPAAAQSGAMVRNAVTFATVINAPRANVWPAIHNAGGWDKWIPFIAEGQCNGIEAGSRRVCVMKDPGGPHDGYRIYEQILENDSDTGVFRYAVQNPPFPGKDFQGRLEVYEQGPRTLIIWTATFEAPVGAGEMIRPQIVKMYQAALMGLEQLAQR